MIGEVYLDQSVTIITKEEPHGDSIDFENNEFLDRIFTEMYYGEEDTEYYTVLIGEDDFIKLYEAFTRQLGYNTIPDDERESLLEVYEMMADVIKEGLLKGVQMGYMLRCNGED